MKTALQQVQLRSNVKNETMAREALSRVKAAGYDGIELNRFMIHKLPFAIRMFTKMAGMEMGAGGNLPWLPLIQASNLSVVSLHCDLGTLEKNTKEVVEEARSFGTDKIVLTGMYHFDYSDEAAVRELIGRLNAVGKTLKEQEIEFLYHNHNVEFLNVRPEKKAYDLIIEETDPLYVGFEFDSYWAAECGADPLLWMKRLGNRMKLYHINDRGNRPAGATGSILKSHAMELGTGCMNLPALLEQAEENGCEAVILETHSDWIDKDALKSMEISGAYLKDHLKG